MRLFVLLAAVTSLAAAATDVRVGEACQQCRSSSSCQALSAPVTRQLQTRNLLPWGTSIAETICHSGVCVPEAAEERDSFCDRLQGRVAAQPQADGLQQAVLRKGSVEAEAQQGSQEKRRLLHEQGQTQAHNGTEDSAGGAAASVAGTGISVQGSSSAADGSAYIPAPASNLNVGDMAAWANGGALPSPMPVAMPVNPPSEPVLTPTGSPADAAGSSPGAPPSGPVVVVPAASQGHEVPMASAPAPANATNSTGDGVDNDAGAQPGANVGGVNYGGGLIYQDYGYGGGGGGGSAGQADIVQNGSPVFPGGVESFQAVDSGVVNTATTVTSPSPPPRERSPRPRRSPKPRSPSPPVEPENQFGGWFNARGGDPTVVNPLSPLSAPVFPNIYLRVGANQDSLLQTDDGTTSFFQPADTTPKANVLAYGKGYVELKGQTIRVIPHVMNLESCAHHCDVDSECTHWRRCAGGDCGARLQECELMSGPVSDASGGAPATDDDSASRTVAPAILEQHTPSIRYIDPSQSNVIMESGTKSPNEFPKALYGCPYPAVPNGQLGQCIPPPQCNCANGVCYGSC